MKIKRQREGWKREGRRKEKGTNGKGGKMSMKRKRKHKREGRKRGRKEEKERKGTGK